eukprot:5764833-Prymnesium_polylepis.1
MPRVLGELARLGGGVLANEGGDRRAEADGKGVAVRVDVLVSSIAPSPRTVMKMPSSCFECSIFTERPAVAAARCRIPSYDSKIRTVPSGQNLPSRSPRPRRCWSGTRPTICVWTVSQPTTLPLPPPKTFPSSTDPATLR